MTSLGETARVAALDLSPEVVGRDDQQALHTGLDTLPDDVSYSFGWECPLGTGPVDFVCKVAVPAGRARLAAVGAPAGDALRRAAKFAAAWGDPNRGLDASIRGVWLRF